MSNRLPALAADVAKSIADMDAAMLSSAQHAIDAGHALIEAKSLCEHGQWLPWLDSTGVPERKAQRLMKLAASGLQSDNMSDLGGISRALRFIRLREAAMRHFENAEQAALAIDRGEQADEITPITWAICHMDEMIRMFPGHEDWTGTSADAVAQ